MSDTPRDCKHGNLARTCETCTLERELAVATARVAELSDLPEEVAQLRTAIRHYEAEVKRLTARAESAERDALQRAAEVCEKHYSDYASPHSLLIKEQILALISKERT